MVVSVIYEHIMKSLPLSFYWKFYQKQNRVHCRQQDCISGGKSQNKLASTSIQTKLNMRTKHFMAHTTNNSQSSALKGRWKCILRSNWKQAYSNDWKKCQRNALQSTLTMNLNADTIVYDMYVRIFKFANRDTSKTWPETSFDKW